jgi:transcription antitermination factor NusG
MHCTSNFEKSTHSLCPWYVLYTKHQHEKSVAQQLTMKGFEILLPLYRTARKWVDRTKVISLPLFPCYVFLRGGLERKLDILETPGVYSILSLSGRPAELLPKEIEDIKRILECGSAVEPHPLLNVGDWVEVSTGPLQGLRGFLITKKNSHRLVLSVEMLGQAASVEVDGSQVKTLTVHPTLPSEFHRPAA